MTPPSLQGVTLTKFSMFPVSYRPLVMLVNVCVQTIDGTEISVAELTPVKVMGCEASLTRWPDSGITTSQSKIKKCE